MNRRLEAALLAMAMLKALVSLSLPVSTVQTLHERRGPPLPTAAAAFAPPGAASPSRRLQGPPPPPAAAAAFAHPGAASPSRRLQGPPPPAAAAAIPTPKVVQAQSGAHEGSCPAATQRLSVDYRMVCDPGHVSKAESGVDEDGKEPRCSVGPVLVCKDRKFIRSHSHAPPPPPAPKAEAPAAAESTHGGKSTPVKPVHKPTPKPVTMTHAKHPAPEKKVQHPVVVSEVDLNIVDQSTYGEKSTLVKPVHKPTPKPVTTTHAKYPAHEKKVQQPVVVSEVDLNIVDKSTYGEKSTPVKPVHKPMPKPVTTTHTKYHAPETPKPVTMTHTRYPAPTKYPAPEKKVQQHSVVMSVAHAAGTHEHEYVPVTHAEVTVTEGPMRRKPTVSITYAQESMPTTHATAFEVHRSPPRPRPSRPRPHRPRPSHTQTSSKPKLDYTEVTIL